MNVLRNELRTVLVTIHQSLRSAIDAVTFDAVLETIRIAHRAAARWGQGKKPGLYAMTDVLGLAS